MVALGLPRVPTTSVTLPNAHQQNDALGPAQSRVIVDLLQYRQFPGSLSLLLLMDASMPNHLNL